MSILYRILKKIEKEGILLNLLYEYYFDWEQKQW